MNRRIKFRGRDINTGEFIYGEAVGFGNFIGCWVRVYGEWELRWFPVYPESIAQLVGYDKDEREVYEGDIVCDKHGIHYVVRLIPQVPVANMTVKEEFT